jgi:polyisoprenoid-binding protein YceI
LFRIAADSVDAGNFIVNSQLKGKDFLDVNNYPEILLTISNVEFTQETNANVSGTLTIKGIAHAVEFPITITGSSFTADFTVDVSQYGISHPNVDNQVHMRVSSQWPNPQ